MTKSRRTRCSWCGERFAIPDGPGRVPKYCRRSPRQRAYEARRVAAARGLAEDEILLSASTWHELRDAIYVAETTAMDAQADLPDTQKREDLIDIIVSMSNAISGVVDACGDPKAVGADG